MKFSKSHLVLYCLPGATNAFTSTSSFRHRASTSHVPFRQSRHGGVLRHQSQPTKLSASGDADETSKSEEAERLKMMAAKLRAEAAALEAKQAKEVADATELAFRKFDADQDGKISIAELKEGLEKALETKLDNSRVEQLMKEFDASGDGALQLEEFVGVEKLKIKLDSIVRDEKAAALAAKNAVRMEEVAKSGEIDFDGVNDGPPTVADKALSVLPYLMPLLDGLQYGRFLLEDQTSNPLVALLTVLLFLYRSVPFSGFIVFLVLNVLSANERINRLVRFNMQQAIFLDISIFIPSLLAGIVRFFGNASGTQVPEVVSQVGSDVVFVFLAVTIGYSVVSSLLGVAPNKIPGISQLVNRRLGGGGRGKR